MGGQGEFYERLMQDKEVMITVDEVLMRCIIVEDVIAYFVDTSFDMRVCVERMIY